MASPVELLIRANAVGFAGVAKELGGLERQFSSLQSVAAGALSFAGIGLGTAEIIQLADAYGQMTGKLKIATQFSGDYAQTMEMLRDSAREARSDLPATIQLYSQLSPALKGIGLSAKESVGILTTINKAIAVSGASSQAAEAALVQLGQGFASGALRGEELNSIMEQTPALAQAIADGLGVSRGALRELGAEGKLTGEVVAQALRKAAAQVDEDFSKMPVTVGQAFTNLRNEFMVFVGASDQAAGGTSALASAINSIADEFKESGPAVTAFSTAISTLINGLDGAYRIIKILGTGLAAYSAMAMQALSGNFAGAKAIWEDLGKDIDTILQKPLAGQAKAIEASTNTARKRLQLEQQLADETIKLEKLKAYEAGAASDNVAAKDKANIDARIADQKRLVDAVRKAWQDSLAEAEKYANAAADKLRKATDFRDEGRKSAFNASLKGLDEEGQAAAKAQRMTDVQGEGSYQAARARMAAIEGDIKKFDSAALIAEKRLKEALQLAQEIGDIASIESISNQLAGIQEAGASLDTKKAEELKAKAGDQAKLLNDLQSQLTALEAKARAIEVQVDVGKAETAIKGLQAQIAEIKDKAVTVTVNTVQAGSVAALPMLDLSTYGPGYATGGRISGPGTGTSDSILARLSNGEYVVKAAAVNHYGANLLNRINNMQIPKFATGGPVGALRQGGGSVVNLSLDGNRYSMSAKSDVAEALTMAIRREALRKGSRR